MTAICSKPCCIDLTLAMVAKGNKVECQCRYWQPSLTLKRIELRKWEYEY